MAVSDSGTFIVIIAISSLVCAVFLTLLALYCAYNYKRTEQGSPSQGSSPELSFIESVGDSPKKATEERNHDRHVGSPLQEKETEPPTPDEPHETSLEEAQPFTSVDASVTCIAEESVMEAAIECIEAEHLQVVSEMEAVIESRGQLPAPAPEPLQTAGIDAGQAQDIQKGLRLLQDVRSSLGHADSKPSEAGVPLEWAFIQASRSSIDAAHVGPGKWVELPKEETSPVATRRGVSLSVLRSTELGVPPTRPKKAKKKKMQEQILPAPGEQRPSIASLPSKYAPV